MAANPSRYNESHVGSINYHHCVILIQSKQWSLYKSEIRRKLKFVTSARLTVFIQDKCQFQSPPIFCCSTIVYSFKGFTMKTFHGLGLSHSTISVYFELISLEVIQIFPSRLLIALPGVLILSKRAY